ncbi:MAG: right-handed parallel beta-helix repeat-containing protein [Armatimonadota bacterium]
MTQSQYTITVGQHDEQIIGSSEVAIQAGVDYLARRGGGTLYLGPGVYRLNSAVCLADHIRFIGNGLDTILLKNPSIRTALADDAEGYVNEIELADATGFEIGYGIALKQPGRFKVERFTIIGKSGNRVLLDRYLVEDYGIEQEAYASTLFPLIYGDKLTDITVQNLVLDGNREQNELIDGNFAAALFLQYCERVQIDAVTAQNYHGDGFSCQTVHDLVIENCSAINNCNLGLHPGSGSTRPIMRNNRIEGGNIGIYFCWSVTEGLAEDNVITGSDIGISIGYCDNDNLVRNNRIIGAKQSGLAFRDEKRPGHNRIECNYFEDCGPVEGGAVIDIQGKTESVILLDNQLVETRPNAKTTAIRLGPDAADITMTNNTFTGFTHEVIQEQPVLVGAAGLSDPPPPTE